MSKGVEMEIVLERQTEIDWVLWTPRDINTETQARPCMVEICTNGSVEHIVYPYTPSRRATP